MFYNQTLLKDGAFMICEDASEYDENVPAQDIAPVQEALKENKTYDPVMKIYTKLRPYYEKAKSFYSYMTPPADVGGMVTNLEVLSDFATDFIDKLRMCEVKMSAMHHATSHTEFMIEPIIQNLGIISKNKNELIKRGYGDITCSVYMNDIINEYNVSKLINIIDLLGYGKKVTVSIDQVASISRWDASNNLSIYSSMEELFDALFNDSIRIKMERMAVRTMDLRSVIDDAYVDNACRPDRPEFLNHRDTKHAFICIASRYLRAIKISLNELIIDAPELEYEQAKVRYIDVVRNAIVALMDLFYVAMLDLHSKAYEIKMNMSIRNCYEDYVRSIRAELKT